MTVDPFQCDSVTNVSVTHVTQCDSVTVSVLLKLSYNILPNNAPRNLGECCTTWENVEWFFKYTRAKRLGLTKFFLIQIFSLQYFHLKLFLCDRQRLNIDGTGRRFCLKFSWEPQNTISSDGTNFPKNFFVQNPS